MKILITGTETRNKNAMLIFSFRGSKHTPSIGFFLWVLFAPLFASAQTIEWIRQFGTITEETAEAVAVDASGVYVAGYTSGTFPGQHNDGVVNDAFVRKYSAAGAELWTRQFGTVAEEQLFDVAVDATGVYVVGYTRLVLPGQPSFGLGSEDLVVRKYDPAGTELWTRQFGSGGDDRATGVAVNETGVYVVGSTNGALLGVENIAGYDVFIRKYDQEGNAKWTRQFGTTATDLASEVAVDATGVYVTGQTNGILPEQTRAGNYDVFVRKYDVDGNEQWTRQFGTADRDERGGVAVDSTGVYVSGQTNDAFEGEVSAGSIDAFIRKYDTAGNELWTSQFGTASDDRQYDVAADGTGVLIVGDTAGTFAGQGSAGLLDGFARKYDAGGALRWTAQFGSSADDLALGVVVTGSLAYVAGNTADELPGQTSARRIDAYVLRITSAPTCTYSITPTSQSFPASGGTGTIGVTTETGCARTAASSDSFVSITSGGSGSGNGTVAYTVAANTTTAARTATITIATQVFTVNQEAAPLPPGPVVTDGGVVNSASFAQHPAPLAPGAMATIFGSNLTDGSAALSTSFGTNGLLVTSLAGTEVRVNGVLAPMFFATPGQLALQIPMEVAGQTTAMVQVTASGQTSAPRTIFVDTASPGIFTINQNGAGPGVITHANGAVVSQQDPARPDEVVVMYATGLGLLNPPLATGAPATSNATALPATVTVDGVPAQVLFSGATPSLVAVNQINFRIPVGTRAAPDIPVVLSIGGKQSNTVTIAVSP